MLFSHSSTGPGKILTKLRDQWPEPDNRASRTNSALVSNEGKETTGQPNFGDEIKALKNTQASCPFASRCIVG